ncbi:MAG: ATPase, T2SS/T4P/T4SS family [Pirellulales bacterium]
MWHPLPSKERTEFDPVLAVLKKLGNLNDADRRARQEGSYEIEFDGKKRTFKIATQGVETGERAVLTLIDPKKIFKTLEELGMRPKLIEQWKELNRSSKGFVLISAPPNGGGFTTLFSTALKECDRLLRDFASVVDKNKSEPEVENVNPNYFDSKAGETPMTVMPDLMRRYPNCYVFPDLVDKDTIELLLDQVDSDHMIYGGVKARESAEAILRVLMMKAPQQRFADALLGVLNIRMIRKLCEHCREPYTPAPDLLKKLNLPADQVTQLYKARTVTPEKEKPCTHCDVKGYYGRTGIIETLFVGDNVRKAIVATPQLDAMRLAARKDGMRTLQEEGILLVAKGITSLDELMRVMKPPEKG